MNCVNALRQLTLALGLGRLSGIEVTIVLLKGMNWAAQLAIVGPFQDHRLIGR